jgi:hypothetical protein
MIEKFLISAAALCGFVIVISEIVRSIPWN